MQPGETRTSYLTSAYGVRSWLLTLDHKRVALLYLIGVTVFFAIGALFAAGMRLELLTPAGDLFEADTYNKLFTMHGVVMVFFFLIPAVPAVLGNFLIPLMIGARNVAFPRLNLASWYLFVLGGVFTLYAMFVGGVDTGWTFYAPYSTTVSPTHVLATAVGVLIAAVSGALVAFNFIVTIHRMRAPGLTWFRLPLFVWAHYASSMVVVLVTPVLAVTVALLGLERLSHAGIFDPQFGGDPLRFERLFWFYAHATLYAMILPSMGVVSELISCFSRKAVFGYAFVVLASLAIALLSLLGWGHHMFVSGESVYTGLAFSLLSLIAAVPFAVMVFHWIATVYRGAVSFEAPMLYALGFVGLFAVGGLAGLLLAAAGLNVHLHDTYFVVAHLHYVMVGAAVMAYMGGLHFWWPKITGRLYGDRAARAAAVIMFVGFNLTFLPQFLMGSLGLPRRYHVYPPEFQVLNVMSTAGASILGVAYVLPLAYLIWSLRHGRRADANPWRATGLEWQTASPPPAENFVEVPVLSQESYTYRATEAGGGI